MGVRRAAFQTELGKCRRIALDSSIMIYHLEDVAPYSDLTEMAFAAIAGGLGAVVSTHCVTELLVKPFAEGRLDRVNAFERFIQSFSHMALILPTYAVAKEAARLRATHKLRTPDALLVATALSEKAEAFLTNDDQLRRVKSEGIAIIALGDYL